MKATINYLDPSVKRPKTYTFSPPPGEPLTTVVNDSREVFIRDIRYMSGVYDLDVQGFTYTKHTSTVKNYFNTGQIKDTYFPEVENLIKNETGASRVHFMGYAVRQNNPVLRVHVDQSLKSGPQRVCDLLIDEADELLQKRFQVINVWRPIINPPYNTHLAVCDASTVKQEQLIPSDLIYPDRNGENYSVLYDPAHSWYYMSDMTPEDVLFLKCYDSKEDCARFAPHTAFTVSENFPKRQSIEVRTLVFYD